MRKINEIAALFVFLVMMIAVIKGDNVYSVAEEKNFDAQVSIVTKEDSVIKEPLEESITNENFPDIDILTDEKIYSFSQGPRAWKEGWKWAGEWCTWGVDGNSFGAFGCGLCCLANIYDSLSPYEVSPWDMFEYARKVSGYSPNGEVGAIGWEDLKATLQMCGFESGIYTKPDSYEEFQQKIGECETAIVLISASNDSTFWDNTYGHYVNIWLYNEETDTVFLADPGMPERNRCRIPLRYVYDALKTSSKYQYLTVNEYKEENNSWKANGITDNWNRP